MYKEWIKRYSGWLILGILLIAAYRLFDNFMAIGQIVLEVRDILTPFIIGAVLAYFLSIPAVWIEKRLLKQPKESILYKKARIISIFITFLSFLILVGATVIIVVPMVSDNIAEFINRSPVYLAQIKNFFRDLHSKYGIPNYYSMIDEKVSSYFSNFMSFSNFDVLEIVVQGIGVVSSVISLFTAIVVCPYIMYERTSLLSIFDHLMLLMISKRDLRFIHRSVARIHKIFADFLFGKAIDSVIIGFIAYFGFRMLGIRFTALFAIVIGLTNMIPYFGPFFGGVPVTLLVILTSGLLPGVWTGLFIFVLQQFDGLILGPYILGESVGVSALWIIFAITFFGGTLGFVGMVMGVPLIAAIRVFYHQLIRYQELKDIIRKHHLID